MKTCSFCPNPIAKWVEYCSASWYNHYCDYCVNVVIEMYSLPAQSLNDRLGDFLEVWDDDFRWGTGARV